MQCNAAPHQIAFACFDDNNAIIILGIIFALCRPLYCWRNIKTTSQNSNCLVLTKTSGQTGLKIRIYTSLLPFSASRVKITACCEDRH